jgi:hypothetical protein
MSTSRHAAEILLDRRARLTEAGATVEYGVARGRKIIARCSLDDLAATTAECEGMPVAVIENKPFPLTLREWKLATGEAA